MPRSTVSSGSAAQDTRFSLRAGAEAGLLGGALFLLLEYFSSALLGAGSPMGPAQITLHSILNLQPGTDTAPHTLTVLIVHFGLSLGTTFVLGYFIHHVVRYWAVTLGAVYGLFLYAINFFVFAFWLPDITAATDAFMVANYMIYGGTIAGLYHWRVPRPSNGG